MDPICLHGGFAGVLRAGATHVPIGPPGRGSRWLANGGAVEPADLECQWGSRRVEPGRLGVGRSSPADSEWNHVVVEPDSEPG